MGVMSQAVFDLTATPLDPRPRTWLARHAIRGPAADDIWAVGWDGKPIESHSSTDVHRTLAAVWGFGLRDVALSR
jgi:hypothetical protein